MLCNMCLVIPVDLKRSVGPFLPLIIALCRLPVSSWILHKGQQVLSLQTIFATPLLFIPVLGLSSSSQKNECKVVWKARIDPHGG